MPSESTPHARLRRAVLAVRELDDQLLKPLAIACALPVFESAGGLTALTGANLREKRLCELSNPDWKALMRSLAERLARFAPSPCHPAPDTIENLPATALEAIRALTADPLMVNAWACPSILGDIYQHFAGPARRRSQNAIQSANKEIDLERLVSFTQLYTPRWVVDFLCESTMLPLWKSREKSDHRGLSAGALRILDPACGSGHFLIGAFDLLTHMHMQEGLSSAEAAECILRDNLYGADIDDTALWVMALSLLVKAVSARVADGVCFENRVNPNGAQAEGPRIPILGSLDRSLSARDGHILARKYHVIVTNPPYIGRKLLDRQLKSELKRSYPSSHQDLCAAFVERSLELLEEGGRLGLIGQASLLVLPTYAELRRTIVEDHDLLIVVDLGPGVFPLQSGAKVNSALMVIGKGHAGEASGEQPGEQPGENIDAFTSTFVDVTGIKDKEKALRDIACTSSSAAADGIFRLNRATLRKAGKQAFHYRCPEIVLDFLGRAEPLSSCADIRQGLATTDNKRFLRYWWDVDACTLGSLWIPYMKGAGGARWYSPVEQVVDWEDGGARIKAAVDSSYPYLKGKTAWVVKNERFYFREGLTFSFVGSRDFALRRMPQGCIFDVAGSALFADNLDLDFLLAYLNSSFARAVAGTINPTVNFQVGDIKRIPLLPFDERERLRLGEMAVECYRHKRELHRYDVTSMDFVPPRELIGIVGGADIGRLWSLYLQNVLSAADTIGGLESEIDRLVLDRLGAVLGLDPKESATIRHWASRDSERSGGDSEPRTEKDFARDLITMLIRERAGDAPASAAEPSSCLAPAVSRSAPIILPTDDDEALGRSLGLTGDQIAWLSGHLQMPVGRYLAGSFSEDHARRFRRVPALACAKLAEGALLVVPSASARRMLSGSAAERETRWQATERLHGSGGTGPDRTRLGESIRTAEKTLDRAVERLRQTPSWTGAHMKLFLNGD